VNVSPELSEERLAELQRILDREIPADSPRADEVVHALCEVAVSEDAERSALGQRLLFSGIAERLGDSFDPAGVAVYDLLFSGVIEFCRHRPDGREIDALLARFGVRSRADLLERRARVSAGRHLAEKARRNVRKVFVLSRVTIGADVAVTSLVLRKLEQVFPHAERVVFGARALEALVAGAKGLRVVEAPYDRRGGLLGRVNGWVRLVEAVDRERGGLAPHECAIVDPDSRLTQLGLLPVVEDEVASFFFESRSFQRPGMASLGQLTARWLDETFGGDESLYPTVWLRASDLATADAVVPRLRTGDRPVVAVNLGVGDNPRKRIAGAFEKELLEGLLAAGATVILDKGIGEEQRRVGDLARALVRDGRTAMEFRDRELAPASSIPVGCELLVYEGGVGALSALIGKSDAYVGYDSAFQHIAAAQAVPVIDVFVDVPSPAFADRWRPYSKAAVEVVRAAPATPEDGIVGRVLEAYKRVRKVGPRSA
jgi:Glycosyltransferase family 9 (heptosyltransferase)